MRRSPGADGLDCGATTLPVALLPHAQYHAITLDPEALTTEIAAAVEISSRLSPDSTLFIPDSRRAWLRLAVAVLIGSLGSVGMWSVVVALPTVQSEFAEIGRAHV